MRWMVVLLLAGFASGQDVPAAIAGSPVAPCLKPSASTVCFELAGSVPEVEARIDANVRALGFEPVGWFDTLEELMAPMDVSGGEVDARWTAVMTGSELFIIAVSPELGVQVTNATMQMGAPP